MLLYFIGILYYLNFQKVAREVILSNSDKTVTMPPKIGGGFSPNGYAPVM